MAAFNFVTGVITIISGIRTFTDKPYIIAIGTFFIVIGCIITGIIIYKIVKKSSDQISELCEGFKVLSEKFEYECTRLKKFAANAQDSKAFQKEILEASHTLIGITQRAIYSALNKKVRVCIKLFRDNSTDNLFTYCRDSLSINESITNEHKEVIEAKRNSDFFEILNGNRDVFIGDNLKKLHKEKKYFNSHSDFSYDSTVVVPIRTLNDNDDFDNIGFLCVDSEEKALFSNEQAENCISFIKASAHIIYILISQGNEYYRNIKEKEEVQVHG